MNKSFLLLTMLFALLAGCSDKKSAQKIEDDKNTSPSTAQNDPVATENDPNLGPDSKGQTPGHNIQNLERTEWVYSTPNVLENIQLSSLESKILFEIGNKKSFVTSDLAEALIESEYKDFKRPSPMLLPLDQIKLMFKNKSPSLALLNNDLHAFKVQLEENLLATSNLGITYRQLYFNKTSSNLLNFLNGSIQGRSGSLMILVALMLSPEGRDLINEKSLMVIIEDGHVQLGYMEGADVIGIETTVKGRGKEIGIDLATTPASPRRFVSAIDYVFSQVYKRKINVVDKRPYVEMLQSFAAKMGNHFLEEQEEEIKRVNRDDNTRTNYLVNPFMFGRSSIFTGDQNRKRIDTLVATSGMSFSFIASQYEENNPAKDYVSLSEENEAPIVIIDSPTAPSTTSPVAVPAAPKKQSMSYEIISTPYNVDISGIFKGNKSESLVIDEQGSFSLDRPGKYSIEGTINFITTKRNLEGTGLISLKVDYKESNATEISTVFLRVIKGDLKRGVFFFRPIIENDSRVLENIQWTRQP
jgi:hypothetical protein